MIAISYITDNWRITQHLKPITNGKFSTANVNADLNSPQTLCWTPQTEILHKSTKIVWNEWWFTTVVGCQTDGPATENIRPKEYHWGFLQRCFTGQIPFLSPNKRCQITRGILLLFSLHFNGQFPGEPGLAGVYWSKGWWRWLWQLDCWSYKSCKAPVRSSPPTNQHPVSFTGQMPLLSPNQQCQSTEGKISHSVDFLTQTHLGSSNFVSDH